jgi:hypothetical protein
MSYPLRPPTPTTITPDMNGQPAEGPEARPRFPVYLIDVSRLNGSQPGDVQRLRVAAGSVSGPTLLAAVKGAAQGMWDNPDPAVDPIARIVVTELTFDSEQVFELHGPLPEIDSITPSEGREGTEITITGRNLGLTFDHGYVGGSRVVVGDGQQEALRGSDTALVLYVPSNPPHAPGPVDVTVITHAGATTRRGGFTFTYLP